MPRYADLEDQIVAKVQARFSTFGGGKPPVFAAGVDVSQVVNFVAIEVLSEFERLAEEKGLI